MDDLISRQSAIDLLKSWSGGFDYIETKTESAIKDLQELPSAEPERKKEPRYLGTYDLLSMLHKAAAITLIGPVKQYGNVSVYQIMDAEEYAGICYVDIYEETGDILRIDVPGINCVEDFKP